MGEIDERASGNPGYALGQIARALTTSQQHADPEVRERAADKVRLWAEVFAGMVSGALAIGSRTPIASAPAWATPMVMQGGFASGRLLAGGPLQQHEKALLERLPHVDPGAERAALNSYYLGDAGLQELRARLADGHYKVGVPEEGALLVVAWLVEHGQAEQARALLDTLGPHLGRLRFYPAPAERPLADSQDIFLQSVGQTRQAFEAIQVPQQIELEREAVLVWAPLYDRVVALFAETVEGPAPTLRTGPDGKPLRDEAGRVQVEGGWPCQRYPDGWRQRASALLDEYARLRARHQLCHKPERKGENFPLLRDYLARCHAAPEQLSGRDVGMVRQILAGISAKRGLPDTTRAREFRAAQASLVDRPTRKDFARLVVARLGPLPQDEGLESLDAVLAPVAETEAARFGIAPGTALPAGFQPRLLRSVAAPVETLVERHVIPSGEVLAQVLPQLTAQTHAAGIVEPSLRRLYRAIYGAFRRRRSLLLLNLESQVKLRELPWVQAIDQQRGDAGEGQAHARQLLGDMVALALTAWPEQILPNKLLQELRQLAETAGLRVPIVDELAADIFVGDFSEKFLRAAQWAGALLEDTLYERYYGLSYAQVRQIDDVQPSQYGAPTSQAFAQLCYTLAGARPSTGWQRVVARNGTIVEQAQILTTHNMAVLFDALGLHERLEAQLPDLARRCFSWICERQQQRIAEWQPRLRMVKNSAYAWRQLVFYLALQPADAVEAFVGWAYDHLRQQQPAFQARFWPALDGLAEAAGLHPQRLGDRPSAPRRLLGWSVGPHWLLAE